MENNIVIGNMDEAYVYISCEEGIAYELREYFSFQIPNARFDPRVKNKIWDGMIYLFNMRNRTIYRGLVSEVIKFCNERGYSYSYEDEGDIEFSLVEAKEFIESLNLPKEIEPRDYQIKAFVHAIRTRRSILLAATNAGKSLFIYLIIRYLLKNGLEKLLIVVPTIGLVGQMHTDFKEYSKNNGWDVDEFVHKIYQGQDKYTKHPVTISTWQSLYTLPVDFFKGFDAVIGDEAHTFKAKSLIHIMTSLSNTVFRIGMSGTLDDTKTHKLVLQGLFGPIKEIIRNKELIDRGFAAKFDIKVLLLKHSEEACQEMKGAKYPQEIEYLCLNERRNKFIVNLATSLEGNTLVLYQLVEKHGKILYKMIKDKVGETRKVFLVYGKTDADVRNEIRGIVEKETDAIIVASFGTFSTGINIKNLKSLIFASPSKARIKILHSIGRVLRLSEVFDSATLYDIADDLRYKKSWRNYTLAHLEARLNMYVDEKFRFKIYNIALKR